MAKRRAKAKRKKAEKRTSARKAKPGAKQLALVVRHRGAGILKKNRGRLALTLCANAAEAEEAGLSAQAAATLFAEKELCEIEWYMERIDKFGDIPPPALAVRCIDKGCEKSDPNAFRCQCQVYSTDDPAKGTPRKEEKWPVWVDEDRWYKCICDCEYAD